MLRRNRRSQPFPFGLSVLKGGVSTGGYYWVYATVAPLVHGHRIVGHTSVRRKVSDELIAKYEHLYANMRLRENMESADHAFDEDDDNDMNITESASFLDRVFGRK